MITTTNFEQKTWRAALQIHGHISSASLATELAALPEQDWEELRRISARLQYVTARRWRTASQRVIEDLDYSIARFTKELERVRQQLPSKLFVIATPREILADLATLEEEFEELTLDLKERSLSARTEPIELDGLYLGPFQIVLHWDQIQRRAYEVIATDPCPAEGSEDVVHPHVRDGLLCEGEGAASIKAALAQGRLLDFFTLVRQILRTYNAESAYVALDRWHGVNCRDCGFRMPLDEHGNCERCNDPLCSDCSTHCQSCDCYVCSGCSRECAECGYYFCVNCVTRQSGSNRLLCESCLQNQEDDADESDKESPADDPPAESLGNEESSSLASAPTDSVRLGETAVPA
jgi:hypothetical protein